MLRFSRLPRWLAAATLFAALATGMNCWAGLALAPGDRAPVLYGKDFQAESVAFEYKTNQVTLINFWATWCKPCVAEMEQLERLSATAEVRVVGVLKDSVSNAEAQTFLESVGVTYPNLRLNEKLNRNFGGVTVLPTSFLVSADGVILRRYVGATPEQVEGMLFDTRAVAQGEPMGPFIFPEEPMVASEEDRLRKD